MPRGRRITMIVTPEKQPFSRPCRSFSGLAVAHSKRVASETTSTQKARWFVCLFVCLLLGLGFRGLHLLGSTEHAASCLVAAS